MKWTEIDYDQSEKTAMMVVPGGTLYKVSTFNGSVALCFAPFVASPYGYTTPAPSFPTTPLPTTFSNGSPNG